MDNVPSFLLSDPVPSIKQKLYNGRKLVVFEGKVRIKDIQGWTDNPRIELAKKKFLQVVGDRPLTQDEILELMKNEPEVELKKLRDDILKNGLRVPLTLSYHGKLLDGNRRFFAIKYALATMSMVDPNKQDLETIEAFVLTKQATSEDEQNVLVEENFSPSLKIEWPDYVKAMQVIEVAESGLSPDEIAKKFNWTKSKIRETLRINEIIQEFTTFAISEPDLEDLNGGGLGLSEDEAEAVAAKNYQFFNEAQKSFFEPLKSDFEFKIQFFKWINEGKFSSFPEVRIAYAAWKNPEAKAAIMNPAPAAAKAAKTILDYNSRILRNTEDAVGRIDNFIKFLKDMTTGEMHSLPPQAKLNLEKTLQLVVKMLNAMEE